MAEDGARIFVDGHGTEHEVPELVTVGRMMALLGVNRHCLKYALKSRGVVPVAAAGRRPGRSTSRQR